MNIDEKLQGWLKSHLTLEDALPTKMPIYVNSMAYFFGTAVVSPSTMLPTTIAK